MENYQGPPMEFSASDYHHAPRPTNRRPSTRTTLHSGNHHRRRSQFSIQSEKVSRSSRSDGRKTSVAETEESYDPFRPSRNQISNVQAGHANVTVLRGPSGSSRHRGISSRAGSVRHPALSRIQGDECPSMPSSPPPLPPLPMSADSPTYTSREPIKRYSSKSSFASSHRTRSSSIGARKSVSHKRGVNFSHLYRRSNYRTSSADQARHSSRSTSDLPLDEHLQPALPSTPSPVARSSPQLPLAINRLRTNVAGTSSEQDVRTRKDKTASQFWKDDARKVSSELEKFCDEAFNRSSIASSTPTAGTVITNHQEKWLESPATSIFVHEDLETPFTSTVTSREKARYHTSENYRHRPLPKPPSSEMTASFAQRELARTRERLKKCAEDSIAFGMNPGYLDSVIAQLDRLMQPSTAVFTQHQQEINKRIGSAPEQSPTAKHMTARVERRNNDHRSASEPTSRNVYDGRRDEKDNIRVLRKADGRPMSPIRPLTIRKRSGASIPEQTKEETVHEEAEPEHPTRSSSSQSNSSRAHPRQEREEGAGFTRTYQSLEPIAEDDNKENYDPRQAKTHSGEGKRRGWFRRQHSAQRSDGSDRGPTPPLKDTCDYQDTNLGSKGQTKLNRRTSDGSNDEFPFREPVKQSSSSRGKFFKLFGKKEIKEAKPSGLALAGALSSKHENIDADFCCRIRR